MLEPVGVRDPPVMYQFPARGLERRQVETICGCRAGVDLVGECDDGGVEGSPVPVRVVDDHVSYKIGAEAAGCGG